MPKKYGNLIKKLTVKKGPEGLYPEIPMFWMEGKDLEGFASSFAYMMIKEPCVLHPIEGMLVHPYDEVLVFGSLDPKDLLYLGAEISIELGAEKEEYIFNEPTVICIPKGVPHGPVKVRRVNKPFAHYMGGLDPVYSAEKIATDGKPSYATTTKYRHLIKKLITVVDNSPSEGRGTGMGYESSVDSRGILHPTNKVGQANADELIWMFGKDLEKFELNLSWGHYSKNGKWHRDAEMHTHPAAEILIFVGMDPDNIEYLGTEMEIGMGMECERHIFNTPTIAVCPSSFVHLPLINRWVDKPYGFIVYCLDGEHDSPWVDIHPDDI